MCKKTSEYKEFIKKYFPYSGVINDESIELIYSRICENNLLTDIYEKYINNEEYNNGISCYLIFLLRYKNHLNKLLIYIALNDYAGVNFCIRTAIENLLKFLYSIYFNKSFKTVNTTSFRHLKEDLNSLQTELFIDTGKLNILFTYYGDFSNSIHDKVESYQSELEYMENIIQSNAFKLNELDGKLVKVLNNYGALICNIFKFSEETFSSSEILRLKNTLSVKRFEKIKQFLYKE